MSDEEFDDFEVDEIFGDIVGSSFKRGEDSSHAITDVYLTAGTVFRFHGVDALSLTEVLTEHGRAELQQADEKIVYLFMQGIASIVGSIK